MCECHEIGWGLQQGKLQAHIYLNTYRCTGIIQLQTHSLPWNQANYSFVTLPCRSRTKTIWGSVCLGVCCSFSDNSLSTYANGLSFATKPVSREFMGNDHSALTAKSALSTVWAFEELAGSSRIPLAQTLHICVASSVLSGWEESLMSALRGWA